MDKQDGGPAFPAEVTVFEDKTGRVGDIHAQHPGMSLRDWFAGQALNGLLSDVDCICGDPETNKGPQNIDEAAKFTAHQAYVMADAMLKAREAGQ